MANTETADSEFSLQTGSLPFAFRAPSGLDQCLLSLKMQKLAGHICLQIFCSSLFYTSIYIYILHIILYTCNYIGITTFN